MTTAPVQLCSNANSSLSLARAPLRNVDLLGPKGKLEAILNEGAPGAPFAVLLCHPHPMGGGTLHNKVVYRAMKVFNASEWGFEWPVLRFNFRGTGLSQGKHDGQAETEDVLAAIQWLENEYNRPIVAAGFSFGAAMILGACCTNNANRAPSNLRALVALGLPTHAEGRDYCYPFLSSCTTPKLFLSGDLDQYGPAETLTQLSASAAHPQRLLLIPGADHFFTDQLDPMQAALAGWLKEQTQ
jgi:alpha/beta superfamily hydrolase